MLPFGIWIVKIDDWIVRKNMHSSLHTQDTQSMKIEEKKKLAILDTGN